jgi:hypothetical protein
MSSLFYIYRNAFLFSTLVGYTMSNCRYRKLAVCDEEEAGANRSNGGIKYRQRIHSSRQQLKSMVVVVGEGN